MRLPLYGAVFVMRKKILWVSINCLFDNSSGASISIKKILENLACDFDVVALQCSVCDVGDDRLISKTVQETLTLAPVNQFFGVKDSRVEHRIYKTSSLSREAVTAVEVSAFLSNYIFFLDTEKPDLVFFYGSFGIFNWSVPYESRYRSIPSIKYVVNQAWLKSSRWVRDVTCVITDTKATAELFRQRLGITLHPLGKFLNIPKIPLNREKVSACRIIIVTPIIPKGILITLKIINELFKRGFKPEVLVFEGRGDYLAAKRAFEETFKETVAFDATIRRDVLNIQPFLREARLVIQPSIWFESGSRVVVEALLNGVPVVSSDRGGSEELLGGCGHVLKIRGGDGDDLQAEIDNGDLELAIGYAASILGDDRIFVNEVEKIRAWVANPAFPVNKVDRLVRFFFAVIQTGADSKVMLINPKEKTDDERGQGE